DERPPTQYIIDVLVAVHVPDIRPLAVIDKQRFAAHAAKRAYRRIYPAGDDFPRGSIQGTGSGVLHHLKFPICMIRPSSSVSVGSATIVFTRPLLNTRVGVIRDPALT